MENIIRRIPTPPADFVLPEPGRVALSENIGHGLAVEAKRLAKDLYSPLHGFRMQKHLQRLIMASALREGRDIVNKDDYLSVLEICNFVNLRYKPV